MGFKVMLDGRSHDIEILSRRPHLTVQIDGRAHEVSLTGTLEEGRQTIEISDALVHFARANAGGRQIVRLAGRTFEAAILDPRSQAEAEGGGLDHIKAPMPGSVAQVHRQAGDEVTRGETLVTIESMKLQTALLAPRDGRIAALLYGAGDRFEKDEIIVQLEPLAGEG